MPGIISPIRGGPGSQPTIDKAIAISKEKHLPLYFLYVVNLDFLLRTETSRINILSEEMHEMGEFILLKAATRAETQNVKVETIVRQGKVREVVINLCQELEADYVVMGQPRIKDDDTEDLFTMEQLTDFTQRILAETSASIVLAVKRSADGE